MINFASTIQFLRSCNMHLAGADRLKANRKYSNYREKFVLVTFSLFKIHLVDDTRFELELLL